MVDYTQTTSFENENRMALWDPISVGVIELPHRLAMHPMTRAIARGRTTYPGPHREYYRQRRLMELTSRARSWLPQA
jgi:hypothetical protein